MTQLARERYKRATRAIRLARAPANSRRAWLIICDAYGVAPCGTPWGSDALRLQTLVQNNSFPSAPLHHALAHRVLNFPSLVRSHDRARRAANLSASMRHKGKLRTLPGNYVALPQDCSAALQDAWRAQGRED